MYTPVRSLSLCFFVCYFSSLLSPLCAFGSGAFALALNVRQLRDTGLALSDIEREGKLGYAALGSLPSPSSAQASGAATSDSGGGTEAAPPDPDAEAAARALAEFDGKRTEGSSMLVDGVHDSITIFLASTLLLESSSASVPFFYYAMQPKIYVTVRAPAPSLSPQVTPIDAGSST